MLGSYELIDCGQENKLERLGPYQVTRQAAQAHWPTSLSPSAWQKVDAVHHRAASGGGHWTFREPLPESWLVRFGEMSFRVKLTDFGHIGLFPEQLENWQWIGRSASVAGMKVLNLFGYTGGSTLAAAAAGAHVTHLDASKGVVSWARENAQNNELREHPIRWVVEDAAKYVQREAKRGSFYQGLILDPPSYGRGPRGQVWQIERDLVPLLRGLKGIARDLEFILLSCHTAGYSPLCLKNILSRVFGFPMEEIQAGENVIPIDRHTLVLPCGSYARWSKGSRAVPG